MTQLIGVLQIPCYEHLKAGKGLCFTLPAALLERNTEWKNGTGKVGDVREGGCPERVMVFHIKLCDREHT